MNKNQISMALFAAALAIILCSIAFLGEYEHRMSVMFVGVVCAIIGMMIRLSGIIKR